MDDTESVFSVFDALGNSEEIKNGQVSFDIDSLPRHVKSVLYRSEKPRARKNKIEFDPQLPTYPPASTCEDYIGGFTFDHSMENQGKSVDVQDSEFEPSQSFFRLSVKDLTPDTSSQLKISAALKETIQLLNDQINDLSRSKIELNEKQEQISVAHEQLSIVAQQLKQKNEHLNEKEAEISKLKRELNVKPQKQPDLHDLVQTKVNALVQAQSSRWLKERDELMRTFNETINSLTKENKRVQSIIRESALVNRNLKEKANKVLDENKELNLSNEELRKQVKSLKNQLSQHQKPPLATKSTQTITRKRDSKQSQTETFESSTTCRNSLLELALANSSIKQFDTSSFNDLKNILVSLNLLDDSSKKVLVFALRSCLQSAIDANYKGQLYELLSYKVLLCTTVSESLCVSLLICLCVLVRNGEFVKSVDFFDKIIGNIDEFKSCLLSISMESIQVFIEYLLVTQEQCSLKASQVLLHLNGELLDLDHILYLIDALQLHFKSMHWETVENILVMLQQQSRSKFVLCNHRYASKMREMPRFTSLLKEILEFLGKNDSIDRSQFIRINILSILQ